MKYDLVMWTRNAGRILRPVLKRIDKILPRQMTTAARLIRLWITSLALQSFRYRPSLQSGARREQKDVQDIPAA